MIEFTPDGPFAGKADPLFPDRVRIIGLGQTGVAACDQLVLHGRAGHDLWAFDSDQQSIDGSIVPNRQLLGRNLVHGLGSSGDIELAREIVALEENRLSPVTRGCDFVILILGLAGCTGLALSEYFIEESRKSGARVIVIGVQPFAFEGWARREKSVSAIAQLRREADSVLVLSQDRIAEDPTTAKNVRHGFHLMHQLVAHTAEALVQIVCKRGLVQLSFADVRSLYGRYAGSEVLENCWVAHVEGDIHDRPEDLITRLLETPLVSDESIWKQVDQSIIAISGTREIGLSDVQEMVGLLKDRLPANLPLAASASLDEGEHDKVRLTVLLAMTAPVSIPSVPKPSIEKAKPVARKSQPAPVPVAATPTPTLETVATEPAVATKVRRVSKSKPPEIVVPPPPLEDETIAPDEEPIMSPGGAPQAIQGKFVAKQEEMQFEAAPRGRFEKTVETIYNGENLDQPTFRRRNLTIRL